MGATTFLTTARGRDVSEAFRAACDHAQYEYERGGYTGTIAEKGSYVLVTLPPRATAEKFFGLIEQDYADPEYLVHFRDDVTWALRGGDKARIREAEKALARAEREQAAWLRKVPAALRPLLSAHHSTYQDKWGPCLAVELTGAERKRYIDRIGQYGETLRRGQRIFVFAGWASC